jgi:hypothetical protein
MKMRLTLWTLGLLLGIAGCAGSRPYNLPPAERLFAPGPGVDGPGPGVLTPAAPPGMAALPGGVGMAMATQATVQILFNRPEGMQVRWNVSELGNFDSDPLVVPGRKNFPEGGVYRLKITNLPGREGVELYPTLEIGPTTPRTAAYLAHNAIPVQLTEEDFDQVLSGNFVTKVIYLPDPEFQEMALAGVETLVSTRLDPGIDPIVEADRRGSIMAVVRLGNKDVEMPDSNMDGVTSAAYLAADGAAAGPDGAMPFCNSDLGPTGINPAYISGVTVQPWGMPMTGTPIGLPGPPHIPLGSPAGLQRHVMRNHTPMHIPGPTEKLKIHVRQSPGFSYPKPPSRVFIREQMIHPTLNFTQPHSDRTQVIPSGNLNGAYCPP